MTTVFCFSWGFWLKNNNIIRKNMIKNNCDRSTQSMLYLAIITFLLYIVINYHLLLVFIHTERFYGRLKHHFQPHASIHVLNFIFILHIHLCNERNAGSQPALAVIMPYLLRICQKPLNWPVVYHIFTHKHHQWEQSCPFLYRNVDVAGFGSNQRNLIYIARKWTDQMNEIR